MEPSAILSRLRAEEPRLRAMGVSGLSLFGSTARGEAGPASDVDLAVTFQPAAHVGLFRFAALSAELSELLNVPVDLVGEPARTSRFQAQIDRDRLRVF